MAGRHHAAVVLPVEGGRPEVDEFDPRVAHPAYVPLAGWTVVARPVLCHEQDVLRLQVRVGQVVIVQELQAVRI